MTTLTWFNDDYDEDCQEYCFVPRVDTPLIDDEASTSIEEEDANMAACSEEVVKEADDVVLRLHSWNHATRSIEMDTLLSNVKDSLWEDNETCEGYYLPRIDTHVNDEEDLDGETNEEYFFIPRVDVPLSDDAQPTHRCSKCASVALPLEHNHVLMQSGKSKSFVEGTGRRATGKSKSFVEGTRRRAKSFVEGIGKRATTARAWLRTRSKLIRRSNSSMN